MKNADSAELIDRPGSLLASATALAVVATLLATRMPAGIRSFQAMFTELGVTPPGSAALVFSVPDIWWLFALMSVALLIWIATRSQVTTVEKRNMKKALVMTVALTTLMYGFAAFAIYTPLFKLGATV